MKVELYHYDNLPVDQITYLDEQNGPISLCITPITDQDADARNGATAAT